jgi:hypothetical protein
MATSTIQRIGSHGDRTVAMPHCSASCEIAGSPQDGFEHRGA